MPEDYGYLKSLDELAEIFMIKLPDVWEDASQYDIRYSQKFEDPATGEVDNLYLSEWSDEAKQKFEERPSLLAKYLVESVYPEMKQVSLWHAPPTFSEKLKYGPGLAAESWSESGVPSAISSITSSEGGWLSFLDTSKKGFEEQIDVLKQVRENAVDDASREQSGIMLDYLENMYGGVTAAEEGGDREETLGAIGKIHQWAEEKAVKGAKKLLERSKTDPRYHAYQHYMSNKPVGWFTTWKSFPDYFIDTVMGIVPSMAITGTALAAGAATTAATKSMGTGFAVTAAMNVAGMMPLESTSTWPEAYNYTMEKYGDEELARNNANIATAQYLAIVGATEAWGIWKLANLFTGSYGDSVKRNLYRSIFKKNLSDTERRKAIRHMSAVAVGKDRFPFKTMELLKTPVREASQELIQYLGEVGVQTGYKDETFSEIFDVAEASESIWGGAIMGGFFGLAGFAKPTSKRARDEAHRILREDFGIGEDKFDGWYRSGNKWERDVPQLTEGIGGVEETGMVVRPPTVGNYITELLNAKRKEKVSIDRSQIEEPKLKTLLTAHDKYGAGRVLEKVADAIKLAGQEEMDNLPDDVKVDLNEFLKGAVGNINEEVLKVVDDPGNLVKDILDRKIGIFSKKGVKGTLVRGERKVQIFDEGYAKEIINMYSAEIEDSIGKGASSSAIKNELMKMADISIDKKILDTVETSLDKDVESEIQKSVEKDVETQIEKQMEKEAWEALGKQEGVETTGKEADVVGLTAYVPDLKATGTITKHDVKNKKVKITLDDKKIVTRDIDKIALTQESAEKIGIKPKTDDVSDMNIVEASEEEIADAKNRRKIKKEISELREDWVDKRGVDFENISSPESIAAEVKKVKKENELLKLDLGDLESVDDPIDPKKTANDIQAIKARIEANNEFIKEPLAGKRGQIEKYDFTKPADTKQFFLDEVGKAGGNKVSKSAKIKFTVDGDKYFIPAAKMAMVEKDNEVELQVNGEVVAGAPLGSTKFTTEPVVPQKVEEVEKVEPISFQKEQKSEDVVYSGAFVKEKAKLQEQFPSELPKKFGDHVTLGFKPDQASLDKLPMGKEIEVKVIGEVKDEKAHALLVQLPEGIEYKGEQPHITLATAEGVSPVYSNTLIKEQTPTMFDTPSTIKTTIGAFTKGAPVLPAKRGKILERKEKVNALIEASMKNIQPEGFRKIGNVQVDNEIDDVFANRILNQTAVKEANIDFLKVGGPVQKRGKGVYGGHHANLDKIGMEGDWKVGINIASDLLEVFEKENPGDKSLADRKLKNMMGHEAGHGVFAKLSKEEKDIFQKARGKNVAISEQMHDEWAKKLGQPSTSAVEGEESFADWWGWYHSPELKSKLPSEVRKFISNLKKKISKGKSPSVIKEVVLPISKDKKPTKAKSLKQKVNALVRAKDEFESLYSKLELQAKAGQLPDQKDARRASVLQEFLGKHIQNEDFVKALKSKGVYKDFEKFLPEDEDKKEQQKLFSDKNKFYDDNTSIASKKFIQNAVLEIMGPHAPDIQKIFVDEILENPDAVGAYGAGLVEFILGRATELDAYHEPIHWFMERVLSEKDQSILHKYYKKVTEDLNDVDDLRDVKERATRAAADYYNGKKQENIPQKILRILKKFWIKIKDFLGMQVTKAERIFEIFERIGNDFVERTLEENEDSIGIVALPEYTPAPLFLLPEHKVTIHEIADELWKVPISQYRPRPKTVANMNFHVDFPFVIGGLNELPTNVASAGSVIPMDFTYKFVEQMDKLNSDVVSLTDPFSTKGMTKYEASVVEGFYKHIKKSGWAKGLKSVNKIMLVNQYETYVDKEFPMTAYMMRLGGFGAGTGGTIGKNGMAVPALFSHIARFNTKPGNVFSTRVMITDKSFYKNLAHSFFFDPEIKKSQYVEQEYGKRVRAAGLGWFVYLEISPVKGISFSFEYQNDIQKTVQTMVPLPDGKIRIGGVPQTIVSQIESGAMESEFYATKVARDRLVHDVRRHLKWLSNRRGEWNIYNHWVEFKNGRFVIYNPKIAVVGSAHWDRSDHIATNLKEHQGRTENVRRRIQMDTIQAIGVRFSRDIVTELQNDLRDNYKDKPQEFAKKLYNAVYKPVMSGNVSELEFAEKRIAVGKMAIQALVGKKESNRIIEEMQSFANPEEMLAEVMHHLDSYARSILSRFVPLKEEKAALSGKDIRDTTIIHAPEMDEMPGFVEIGGKLVEKRRIFDEYAKTKFHLERIMLYSAKEIKEGNLWGKMFGEGNKRRKEFSREHSSLNKNVYTSKQQFKWLKQKESIYEQESTVLKAAQYYVDMGNRRLDGFLFTFKEEIQLWADSLNDLIFNYEESSLNGRKEEILQELKRFRQIQIYATLSYAQKRGQKGHAFGGAVAHSIMEGDAGIYKSTSRLYVNEFEVNDHRRLETYEQWLAIHSENQEGRQTIDEFGQDVDAYREELGRKETGAWVDRHFGLGNGNHLMDDVTLEYNFYKELGFYPIQDSKVVSMAPLPPSVELTYLTKIPPSISVTESDIDLTKNPDYWKGHIQLPHRNKIRPTPNVESVSYDDVVDGAEVPLEITNRQKLADGTLIDPVKFPFLLVRQTAGGERITPITKAQALKLYRDPPRVGAFHTDLMAVVKKLKLEYDFKIYKSLDANIPNVKKQTKQPSWTVVDLPDGFPIIKPPRFLSKKPISSEQIFQQAVDKYTSDGENTEELAGRAKIKSKYTPIRNEVARAVSSLRGQVGAYARVSTMFGATYDFLNKKYKVMLEDYVSYMYKALNSIQDKSDRKKAREFLTVWASDVDPLLNMKQRRNTKAQDIVELMGFGGKQFRTLKRNIADSGVMDSIEQELLNLDAEDSHDLSREGLEISDITDVEEVSNDMTFSGYDFKTDTFFKFLESTTTGGWINPKDTADLMSNATMMEFDDFVNSYLPDTFGWAPQTTAEVNMVRSFWVRNQRINRQPASNKPAWWYTNMTLDGKKTYRDDKRLVPKVGGSPLYGKDIRNNKDLPKTLGVSFIDWDGESYEWESGEIKISRIFLKDIVDLYKGEVGKDGTEYYGKQSYLELDESNIKAWDRQFAKYADTKLGNGLVRTVVIVKSGGNQPSFIIARANKDIMSLAGDAESIVFYFDQEVERGRMTEKIKNKMVKDIVANHSPNNKYPAAQAILKHEALKRFRGSTYLLRTESNTHHSRRMGIDDGDGIVALGVGPTTMKIINQNKLFVAKGKSKPIPLVSYIAGLSGTYRADGAIWTETELMDKTAVGIGRMPVRGGTPIRELKTRIRFISKNDEFSEQYYSAVEFRGEADREGIHYAAFKSNEFVPEADIVITNGAGDVIVYTAEENGMIRIYDGKHNRVNQFATLDEAKEPDGGSGAFALNGRDATDILHLPEEARRIVKVPNQRAKDSAAFPWSWLSHLYHSEFDSIRDALTGRMLEVAKANIRAMFLARSNPDVMAALMGQMKSDGLSIMNEVDRLIEPTPGQMLNDGYNIPHIITGIIEPIKNKMIRENAYKGRRRGLGNYPVIKPDLSGSIVKKKDGVVLSADDHTSLNFLKTKLNIQGRGVDFLESINESLRNNPVYMFVGRHPVYTSNGTFLARVEKVLPTGHGNVAFFHPETVKGKLQADHDGDNSFILSMYFGESFQDNSIVNTMKSKEVQDAFKKRDNYPVIDFFKKDETEYSITAKKSTYQVGGKVGRGIMAQGILTNAIIFFENMHSKGFKATIGGQTIVARNPDEMSRVMIYAPFKDNITQEMLDETGMGLLVDIDGGLWTETSVGEKYLKTSPIMELQIIFQAAVDNAKDYYLSHWKYDGYPFLMKKMFVQENGSEIGLSQSNTISFVIRKLMSHGVARRGRDYTKMKTQSISEMFGTSKEIYDMNQLTGIERGIEVTRLANIFRERHGTTSKIYKGSAHIDKITFNNKLTPIEQLLSVPYEIFEEYQNENPHDKVYEHPFGYHPNRIVNAIVQTQKDLYTIQKETERWYPEEGWDDKKKEALRFINALSDEFYRIIMRAQSYDNANKSRLTSSGYPYADEMTKLIQKWITEGDKKQKITPWGKLDEQQQAYATLRFLRGVTRQRTKAKNIIEKNVEKIVDQLVKLRTNRLDESLTDTRKDSIDSAIEKLEQKLDKETTVKNLMYVKRVRDIEKYLPMQLMHPDVWTEFAERMGPNLREAGQQAINLKMSGKYEAKNQKSIDELLKNCK